MNSRILRKKDINQCTNIIKRALGKRDGKKARNSFLKGLTKSCEELGLRYLKRWVLIKRNKIIGVYGLYSRLGWSRKYVAIAWFALEPKERGNGYGKKLVKEMEKIAYKRKYSYLVVWSDKKAIEFYRRAGFKKSKRPLLPIEGSQMMVKRLSNNS